MFRFWKYLACRLLLVGVLCHWALPVAAQASEDTAVSSLSDAGHLDQVDALDEAVPRQVDQPYFDLDAYLDNGGRESTNGVGIGSCCRTT